MSVKKQDKKYFVSTDKSNGVDYTCRAIFYIDSQGRYHLVNTIIEPPQETQHDKSRILL